ncbi:MAG: Gfo/Idh/MocA family oxidoreductase [Candidatus Bathyarchaeia archaeon]
MEKLSIALIGCGGMMGTHVVGYRDLYYRGMKIFDIRATCDSVEFNAVQKAEEVAAFQGSKPKVYTDLDTMLNNESLDAVDIALPHNIHHTIACKCLEKGLDVIIEKPLGITMRAAKLIIEKAQKHSRILAVAENYRRSPENRAIWWAIRQGFIGEPRMISWIAADWGPKPWGWREDKFIAGGSWVFDGGVHLSDLDRYHLGKEAIDVYAVQETFDPIKEGIKVTVDDMTMAIIRFEGRIYAQWLWTRAAPGKRISHRTIYGSKGSLDGGGLTIQKEDSIEVQSMHLLVNKMRASLSPEERESKFPRGATDTVATELYDFYESVINKRKPEVDGLEAYKDMAIPIGFYESATIGKPVKIVDIEGLRIEEYQKEINEKLGI